MQDMPIIHRRRIEAEILLHVFGVLAEKLGEEQARELLAESTRRAAVEQGASLAARQDGTPDLADFYELLPLWTKEGALEIDVLEHGPESLQFNVTRCRYAEMYRAMGAGDLGGILSCGRDGHLCEGYNPEIDFQRTQTIMQGASHCDFRFSLKK